MARVCRPDGRPSASEPAAEAPRIAALGRRRRGADRQRWFWANDTGLPESFYLGGYLGHLLPQTQRGPLFDEIIKDDLVTVDFTAAGATALACLALDHGGAQPDAVRLTVEGDLADEPSDAAVRRRHRRSRALLRARRHFSRVATPVK